MKIKLNDRYTLVSVPLNFYIEETRPNPMYGKKVGRHSESKNEFVTTMVTGYYWSFVQLIDSFINHKLQDCEAETLEELRDKINEINADVHDICTELNKRIKTHRTVIK